MEPLSLYDLNHRIARAVTEAFAAPVWVVAEMADVRVAANGHCYMEFVEKHPSTGALIARARGIVWASRLGSICRTFEAATGQPLLQAGLKVMACVTVQMHEAFGLSLVVTDIDPTYTLGELARRRQEILRRLADEGMLDMQRALPMPLLPQRVAVISAAGAAGYGDFCHQLAANEWGARFYTHLFAAVMQGTQTEASIIAALERIYAVAGLFDVVVIIRGGGATADLASFDSYALAMHVANFPLPVVTGIGHERDQTVLDAVAHTSVKTPTAAAALLIDLMHQQVAHLDELQQQVAQWPRAIAEREQQRLSRMALALRTVKANHIAPLTARLSLLAERARLCARQRIDQQRGRLAVCQNTIDLMQPIHILKRGFSITRADGRAIKSLAGIRPGQSIETEVADGRLTSVVCPHQSAATDD